MSVVVIGSINADLVLTAQRAPDAGETLHGRDFSTGVGGKGLNQCAAIALQSIQPSRVAMVGCIGEDPNGQMCMQAMQSLRVNIDHVRTIKDISTGVAVIVVEDSGDNRILLSAGANNQLSQRDIEAAQGLMTEAAVVVLQLESPLAIVQYAAQVAQKTNACTILNPAPAQELSDELLSHIDLLIPNETEAGILTGQTVDSFEDARKAGTLLLERGVKQAVVITRGGEGCVLVTRDLSQNFAAQKVKAIDTTAAGDSFIGGLAVKLAEGRSLHDAIQFGQKVAAVTVTRKGALKSIPTRNELDHAK